MRVSSGFLTFALLICLAPATNSQVQIIMKELSCEGASDFEIDLPPCESAWRPSISVVFLGRATDVRKEEVPIIVDGKKELTERLHVTFQVEEAFRGASAKVISVVSGGDLCGEDFSKGNRYLVYGRRLASGEVYVSSTSNTKWVKDSRGADDLKYLRGLPMAPHGGTIYGSLFRYTTPDNPKLQFRRGVVEAGHRIEFQGNDKNYDAIVDHHGNFRISGLPPGQYKILLNEDGEIDTWPKTKPTSVDLADKACARFDFHVDPFAKKDSRNADGKENGPSK